MGAIRDTIYNNYLSAYAPKELTRYDSHKKSELRNVYNSIVKLNKESPWHLPIVNKDTQNYAVNLKENARQLYNTLASVGGLEEEGLFNKKSAYSTDSDLVAASIIGDASSGETNEFEIEVHNLASPQENLGKFLDNRRVSLPADTYSFDLSINDMSYEFQFAIGADDTNKEIQERLARLMNNASVGLKASVVESGGRTALKMTSESHGLSDEKEHIFSITDNSTSMQKGAVDYFGLNYTATEASNARFLLNGEEHTASSNRFSVGKMFELQLKGVTPPGQPVKIGVKADVESLADNVSTMVDGYNDFMKTATSYQSSQRLSGHLVNEMRSIASFYTNTMGSLGLSMDSNGIMTLDRSRLRESAENSEDISHTFNSLKDFSKSLMRKSDQVSLNPMEYVDKKIVAYKNPGHNFASPYISSAYSGMLFNFFC